MWGRVNGAPKAFLRGPFLKGTARVDVRAKPQKAQKGMEHGLNFRVRLAGPDHRGVRSSTETQFFFLEQDKSAETSFRTLH